MFVINLSNLIVEVVTHKFPLMTTDKALSVLFFLLCHRLEIFSLEQVFPTESLLFETHSNDLLPSLLHQVAKCFGTTNLV